jgi:hypothetical protein
MSEIKNNTFSLNGVKITKLPDNFKINESLDLRGSLVVKLPKGLVVLGDLILNEFIEEIPEDIMIGGDLDISATNISKLPNHFALCGNILGSKHNLSKPVFTPNTIYKNIICCDDGSLILYKKSIFKKRPPSPGQKEKEPLTFYYGLNGVHAVSLFKQKKIFACESFSKGERIADLYLLSLKDLSKYSNLDITKKIYTIDELKEMYIDISNPCTEGVQDFLVDINLDFSKKYSIKNLIDLLPKYAKESDYFPFMEVFKKQIEQNKKERYFIIN